MLGRARRLLKHHELRRFSREVGWTFAARLVSALLQTAVLLLLARGLVPHQFAMVASANALLMLVIALNGFGLVRQIQYRRSVDPSDPVLANLFSTRLRYTYASALAWALGALTMAAITGRALFVALVPAALWLLFEQVTQVWNAISIIDGRNHDLMSSYLTRRLPVVVVLGVASVLHAPIIWSWTIGLAFGGALSYVVARGRQEPWARSFLPTKGASARGQLDLGFWWSQVAYEIGELDVLALTATGHTLAGVYALPRRFLAPMNMASFAAAASAFPRLSRLRQIGEEQWRATLLAGFVPGAVVCLGGVLAAPLLPLMAGQAYADSVPVMRILSLAALVAGPTTMLVTLLQSRGARSTRHAGKVMLVSSAGQVAAVWGGTIAAGITAGAICLVSVRCLALLVLMLLSRRLVEIT